MKIFYCFLVIVLSRQTLCGILRNPPAFSKPVYSDSYLPAAMQVIFHAVEQLKLLQSEEIIHSSTNTGDPSTSPITLPDQDQQTTPQDASTSVTITQEESNAEEEESKDSEDSSRNKEEQTSQQCPGNKPEESKIEEETEEAKVDETSTEKVEGSKIEDASKVEEMLSDSVADEKEPSETKMDKMEEGTSGNANAEGATAKPVESAEDHTGVEESPELNEETPETNYATPETNYEKPEEVHAVEETNQEADEENHEWISSIDTRVEVTTTALANPPDSDRVTIIGNDEKKKEPTIDSVVQGVYEILKPTTSKFVDEELFEEHSKSIVGVSMEKMERAEEESDENRFTRLGEKVTQVPRPSLTSYLRRSKVPPSATLQQLANLYDSLSKDARKQGFGKYTGYSDEVLNTLETSAEGGIGPQMKKILSKVLERNELTREDARMRASQAVRDLDNPSSMLNKDLRAVLPLRYSP